MYFVFACARSLEQGRACFFYVAMSQRACAVQGDISVESVLSAHLDNSGCEPSSEKASLYLKSHLDGPEDYFKTFSLTLFTTLFSWSPFG